jgi:hypothetical protein
MNNSIQAPESIVDHGRMKFGSWSGYPGEANLLDAVKPYRFRIPRILKRTRLKEWRALQAGDDTWFIFAVLYDAKFISMASVDLWNRKEKAKHGFRRMFPLSRFIMSRSLEFSETHADQGTDRLSIRIDPEASFIGLHARSKPSKAAPEDITLDLRFDFSPLDASPISVCMPLGENRGIYSTKVLLPCSGVLSIDGYTHRFDTDSASGAFDDHKGYYPYRLHYDWVTGFGIDAQGRRIGFNLTDNQVLDQELYNENRLWIGKEVHTLPPVRFERPDGREGPWIIRDKRGVVDLRFFPEVAHDISMKLGVAAIDYAGPFGGFSGGFTLQGQTIDASHLFGMGEDKSVRL